MATGTAARQRLHSLIEPVVSAAGFDLEDLVVTPAGRRSLVRVVVDGEHGVSLDDVADLSRAVSERLDAEDDGMGASPYVLEVSSPGVDRPLTLPRHWQRAVGRLVCVQSRAGAPVTGRLLRTDAAGVVLAVGGSEQEIRHDDITRAQVEVEFSRPGAVPDDTEDNIEDDIEDGQEGS